jgi:hypothetical protein
MSIHAQHGPMKPPTKKEHEAMHGGKKDKPAARRPPK